MQTEKTWLTGIVYGVLSTPAALTLAQEAPDRTPPTLNQVVVSGRARAADLDRLTPTASRLGLTARETPATIDSIDAGTMEARGYQHAEQAVDSMPGVSSGGAPASPSQFSMRGFSGDQVTILRDGIYLGPPGMTYRSQNSFNLQRIDVLKGPGSVLYGQGAIAGTVNLVAKQPALTGDSFDAMAALGRYGDAQAGVGGNVLLARDLALRADLSRTGTRGYVHGAGAHSLNGTLALLWKPDARFDLGLGVDALTDRPSPYFGTPLVPAAFARAPMDGVVRTADGSTLDRRMRYVNYNVADYQIASTQYLPRATLHWKPEQDVTISNDVYYFHADRKWKNAETYAFNAATGLVERDRFFVFHHQRLYGDQFNVTYAAPLAGRANRFLIGMDYSKLDFVRTRGFPDGDSVDPFHPAPGAFGPLAGRRSPTRWADRALLLEDALDLRAGLKLVGGGRLDDFQLVRENYAADGHFLAASSFQRTFKPRNWRLGLVHQGPASLTPYVQYSTGQDPVGANILLVNAGQNFELSKSHQAEIGVKADLDDRRGHVTVAYYTIARHNLLTQTGPDAVDNVGSQKSRGVEALLDYKPLSGWSINLNAAHTDARYGRFIDTSNGVDAGGNRPANIPNWSGNLCSRYSNFGGLPLEVGAGVRYLGERFGNTANTLVLRSYTLVDLFAIYHPNKQLDFSVRVNNATNKASATWADVNYPNQIQLGAPISYEIALVARF